MCGLLECLLMSLTICIENNCPFVVKLTDYSVWCIEFALTEFLGKFPAQIATDKFSRAFYGATAYM